MLSDVGCGDCANQRAAAKYSGAVVPKSVATPAKLLYVRILVAISITAEVPRINKVEMFCACAPAGVKLTLVLTKRLMDSELAMDVSPIV